MGKAVPVRIGRHVHPQARAEAAPEPVPTGIDYLSLIAGRREAELAGQRIAYAALAGPGDTEHTDTEDTEDTDHEDQEERG